METWVVWMGEGCCWWQGARSDPGGTDTLRCLVVGNSEASSVDVDKHHKTESLNGETI